MKLSLKSKLSLMFLIFISIPLIALGTFSYVKSSSAMQNLSEQELKETTKLTAENINNIILSSKNSIEILSVNNAIIDSVINTNPEVKLKGYNFVTDIQKKFSTQIETIVVIDTTGKALYSSGNLEETTNLSDREYFKMCITGIPAQSDVIKSKVTGNSVIALAYPLMSNNKVVGAIVGTIKFEIIAKQISSIKIGTNGYCYMINKDGIFIYHPKTEKILDPNQALYITAATNTQLNKLTDIMKEGRSGSGEYTYEGVRKYVAFEPINGWTVATTANYKEYMSAALSIRNYTIIFVIIALIIAMLVAFLMVTRSIVNPIKKLESLMAKAGDGDLTVLSEIKTKDEIEELGESFNKMIVSQKHIIEKVRIGAEDLSASSEEMAASSEEISASVELVTKNVQAVADDSYNQKNAVVETSKVLVQLSSLIAIAQNKALTAKKNSNNSMNIAHNGRIKVEDTVKAINNITNSTEETANILTILEELSKKVGGIITTINGISDQTNLLVLNAAIEAARAGEHGKGFSVVADEVRKLSEQSTLGAKEISQLVNEMVNKIELAVKSMQQGKESVKIGVEVVKNTDEAFIKIINSVEQIVNDVGQIVDITKDEVANSDQIVKLIDTIATLAESNAANSQDVAASSEEQSASIQNLTAVAQETSALAYELNKMVEKFRI